MTKPDSGTNTAATQRATAERMTDSGISIPAVFPPDHVDYETPGQFPYTRGVYGEMYRDRLWTMRQYAGFGTAEATNRRFHFLLEAGQSGLSCAFDLPTQMGIDSDDERAIGEVGRVGVAIDCLDDMRSLLRDIPLGSVSLSMTINATAPLLLLLVQLVAEEQGIDPTQLQGTIQNDILKEYVARGTYIYPTEPSLRLVSDTIAYCYSEMPRWHPISISGYHMREAGATAVQELAFTLANAIAYVDAALSRGLLIDDFAPRLSFFWNAHNNLLEEIAKFRAARRLWATIVRERWGGNDKSAAMRFHTQTAGSTLTAQQPLNNVVRTTVQALAAVFGGTQSLHTNAFDEALGLPTEDSAKLALRTQQIIAAESGVVDTVDPWAGSYAMESLTASIEQSVHSYLTEIEHMGGAVAAIDAHYMQDEIERSALAYARSIDNGERSIVGVNAFTDDEHSDIPTFPIDNALAEQQIQQLQARRAQRDMTAVTEALEAVRTTAHTDENLLPVLKVALSTGATVGECSDALRDVFGQFD